MVNLFKYAGKRIKATFRSGDSLIGVLQVNKGTDYPYWFLGSSYTQGGLWIRGEERQGDIVSVELIEETAMSNKVDLSKYVGKKVKAKLRGGITVTDRVMRGSVEEYPFTLSGYSYASNGRRLEDNDHPRDIISLVELVEVVKGQPASGESIYVARNLDGKFLFASPALKTLQNYVRGNYPADTHLDINITTEYLTTQLTNG